MASRCLVASPLPRFLFDLMLVAMGFVGNIVEPILTSSNGGHFCPFPAVFGFQ